MFVLNFTSKNNNYFNFYLEFINSNIFLNKNFFFSHTPYNKQNKLINDIFHLVQSSSIFLSLHKIQIY